MGRWRSTRTPDLPSPIRELQALQMLPAASHEREDEPTWGVGVRAKASSRFPRIIGNTQSGKVSTVFLGYLYVARIDSVMISKSTDQIGI